MWHNITDRVTNVAGQVTSTVKELATEVLDNEREIRAEEKQHQHRQHQSVRAKDEAPASATTTTTTTTTTTANSNNSRLDSLKSRIEQDRNRSNRQHELLERIRAARQAASSVQQQHNSATQQQKKLEIGSATTTTTSNPPPTTTTMKKTETLPPPPTSTSTSTSTSTPAATPGATNGVLTNHKVFGVSDGVPRETSQVLSQPGPAPAATGLVDKKTALAAAAAEATKEREREREKWKKVLEEREEMLEQCKASLASVSSELESTRGALERKQREVADLQAEKHQREVEESQENQLKVQSQDEAKMKHEMEIASINSEKDRLQRHLLEIEADQEDQVTHYEQQIQTLQEALTRSQLHEEELLDLRKENALLREENYKAKAAVDSKGYEIMNLQSALGQLTADSELCGQYRSEIQRLGVKIGDLEKDTAKLREEQKNQRKSEEALRTELELATRSKDEVFQESIRFKQENLKLRQALHECLEQIKAGNSDQDNQIDRRIVYKLLSTYFEKGCEAEVMKVMGGILGFTEEEQLQLQQLAGKTGTVLGTVANVPISIVKAPLSLAGNAINKVQVPETDSSLGEAWIQFLTDSIEAPEPHSPVM